MERRGLSRLGLLGGTFDPPHVGHLWLATLARDALELDRVIFMPAPVPPHKLGRPISPIEDRVALVAAAIAGDESLALSTLELDGAGPSYTIDTVERLLPTLASGDELVLLMAADSLAEIDGWREPERLLRLVRWGIGPRPGGPMPDRSALAERFGSDADRITILDGPALDVSASAIRARVAAGRAIRYLVPERVEAEIAARHLYAGAKR
jgi:nicotinate-nucleotide adenylyltransferase